MEKINNDIFRSITCYNKYMTRGYYDKLTIEAKLAFLHPDDRELYEKYSIYFNN